MNNHDEKIPHFKFVELQSTFKKFFPPLNNQQSFILFNEHFNADSFEYENGSLYESITYLMNLCNKSIRTSLQNVLTDYNITENNSLSNMDINTFNNLIDSIVNISLTEEEEQ